MSDRTVPLDVKAAADTKGDPNGAAGDPVALRAQVSLQSS
jgi:hypothetical protein